MTPNIHTHHDNDTAAMLHQVLAQLPHLRSDPRVAQQVFDAVRNQALQPVPNLPKKCHLLARFAALTLSISESNLKSPSNSWAASTCASITSCIARTENHHKAALYIEGLCDAVEQFVSNNNNNTMRFLEKFEQQFAHEFFPIDIDATKPNYKPKSNQLPVYRDKKSLRNLVNLISVTICLPARANLHGDSHSDSNSNSKLERNHLKYNRYLWTHLNKSARARLAATLSSPALLAGSFGAFIALDTAKSLLQLIICVHLPQAAFENIANRVGVALESHCSSNSNSNSNSNVANFHPIRSQVVTLLLRILAIATSDNICPRLWSITGIPIIVHTNVNSQLRKIAVEIVENGAVSIHTKSLPLPTHKNNSSHSDNSININNNILLPTTPISISILPFEDNEEERSSTSSTFQISSYSTPAINDASFDYEEIDHDARKVSPGEKTLILALFKQLKNIPDNVGEKHFARVNSVVFLVLSRTGIWKQKCSFKAWNSLANRILIAASKIIRRTKERNGVFQCTHAILQLLTFVLKEAPVASFNDTEMDMEMNMDMDIVPWRKSQISADNINVWTQVLDTVVNTLNNIFKEPINALLISDYKYIPKVLHITAQFTQGRLYRAILPDQFVDKLLQAIKLITEKGLAVAHERRSSNGNGNDNHADIVACILKTWRTVALICPDITGIVEHSNNIAGNQFLPLLESPSQCVRTAAVQAIQAAICISAKCTGKHRNIPREQYTTPADPALWKACSQRISAILKNNNGNGNGNGNSNGNSNSISSSLQAAVQALESLVVHAGSEEDTNECINLLVGCVWNLNDFGARKHAVRTIETLISQGNCSSLSSQLLSEFQANQHDPRIAGLIARIESAQPDVKKTVVLALDQVIHNAVNELLKIEDVLISLKKQNTFDPAASSMLLDDVRAGGIDSNSSDIVAPKNFSWWRELLTLAAFASNYDSRGSNFDTDDDDDGDDDYRSRAWFNCGIDEMSTANGNRNVNVNGYSYSTTRRKFKYANNSELCSFLGLRMKDWLPLSLERMLRNKNYLRIIAALTMERNEKNLWRKCMRYGLAGALRDERNNNNGNGNDQGFWMIDELALRLDLKREEVVDRICADTIAANALASTNGIDLNINNHAGNNNNGFIVEALQMPMNTILEQKGNKIVQRLVMELGGVHDFEALRALTSLATILNNNNNGNGNGNGNRRTKGARNQRNENELGVLISTHFLLVMDTVDQVLLDVDTADTEKIRYLGVLQSVLNLAKEKIAMYVHKVYSSLKVCLTHDGSDISHVSHVSHENVKKKTVQVWATLLSTLGPQNIAPHLSSMLATFLPHTRKYSDDIVVPVLRELFSRGKEHMQTHIQEIRLIYRTVTDNSLRKVFHLLEMDEYSSNGNGNSNSDVIMIDIDQPESNTNANSSQEQPLNFQKYSDRCHQLLDVAIRHKTPELRSIALAQLLGILKAHRHHHEKLLQTLTTAEFLHSNNNNTPPLLALLVTNLTLLVAESKDGCDAQALRCLGELGAVDPALISGHTKNCLKRGENPTCKDIHTYYVEPKIVAQHILEYHLGPALWRNGPGDTIGSRLNRVGLAIQELLKAVHCDRKTAEKTIKVRNDARAAGKQSLDLKKLEDGVFFWLSLSEVARTAAQPYLKEPFNVQKYESVMGTGKKFDFQAACMPIWSKLAADGKKVDVVEWRRQLVFQAIDFIGGEYEFGKLFCAVRPSLRYEVGVAAAVFPYVLAEALEIEAKEFDPPRHFLKFVISEIKCALSGHTGAVQCAFKVMDTLRNWRDDRTKLAAREKLLTLKKRARQNLASSGRNSATRDTQQSIWNREKKDDSLTPIVDISGNESRELSLLSQSKAALSARSYARVVLLSEQEIRNCRAKNGNHSWPAFIPQLLQRSENGNGYGNRELDAEESSLSVLQAAFAELEDADGVKGVAALRKSSTLSESIVDAEASGDYDEALLIYERSLRENLQGREQYQKGFLRCLCTLGHWETMLTHAVGLSVYENSNESQSQSLVKSTRCLGIEAAWRLGRWDKLDELCKAESTQARYECFSSNHDNGMNMKLNINGNMPNVGAAVGRALLRVHQKEWDAAKNVVRKARNELLPHVAHAALEGYARAYPLLVQLHTLADVEDLGEFTKRREIDNQSQVGSREDHDIELARINCRSNASASSLKVREPILSVRRACLEILGYRSMSANVSIEFAQLARESGNFRAASAAASHALPSTGSAINGNGNSNNAIQFASATEIAHIQRARGDSAGALVRLKKVITEMTRTLETVQAGNQGSGTATAVQRRQRKKQNSIDEIKSRLCAAHVLAGQWTEESRSESSEVILTHFGKATEYCPKNEQAFYALGRHYDSLWQAALAKQTKTSHGMEGRSYRSQSQGISVRNSSKSVIKKNHYEYVPLIINNFAKALENGHARLFEALPRLLTVWFDFYSKQSRARNKDASIQGVESLARSAIRKAFKFIPMYMWMSVVPQLMSRMLHESTHIQTEVSNLLARLLVRFPKQGIWSIASASELKSTKRKDAVAKIINKAVASLKRSPKTSQATHNSYSSSAASTPEERRAAAQELNKTIHAGLAVIKNLISICMKETKTRKGAGGMLDCGNEFYTVRRNMDRTELMIPTLRELTVTLPTMSRSLSSSNIDGHHSHQPFAEQPVSLSGIDDTVLVMSSLMAPRRITFKGSDGRKYRFLAKRENNGDMRKDSRLMEFVSVVNRLLAKDSQSVSRELKLKTYAVIPLTEETGIIEWVNDLAPLRQIVRTEQLHLGRPPEGSTISEAYNKYKNKTQFLTEWALRKFPPMMDRFFLREFAGGCRGGDARTWLDARTLWIRSVATWSITGYIVGLGDRHAENILMEITTGRAIHVDFAMLFEKGTTLKVPECVPFRLTSNMVAAFGISGTEGAFKACCETVMNVMRSNEDALMGTIESFVHDPLVEISSSGAIKTNEAVRNKLRGLVDNSGMALSVPGQVGKLIEDATNVEKLGAMYIWWSAWT